MSVSVEYWTTVYAVGLEGLNDYDHDELNALAADGWEPVLMTSVHAGFGALVLFRREASGTKASAARKAAPARQAPAAKKAAPAKKTAAAKKAAPARKRA